MRSLHGETKWRGEKVVSTEKTPSIVTQRNCVIGGDTEPSSPPRGLTRPEEANRGEKLQNSEGFTMAIQAPGITCLHVQTLK